ncbi:MAG: hypothetical protein D6B28_06190 [Gammaproteobacteria bacterium]|nr:MAG: hypothetical protein D6B28_06190 [Gammaproteobacteria bacterium]
MTRILILAVALFASVGCSSDSNSDNKPEKNENPVDTYMDYNKNVMKKPQQVQQQMDKIMQQRQEQLEKAEDNQY